MNLYASAAGEPIPRPYRGVMRTDDGRSYGSLHDLEWTATPGGMAIRADPPVYERVNTCPHCGRADFVEVTCGSFAELLERGWLVPIEEGPA